MSDRLGAAAPPPPPLPPGVETTVPDLQRILALPRRAPLNCERDPITRRYQPATQALIEIVTSRYARPKRLSCACRPRRVQLSANGVLTISRVMLEGEPPEPPLLVNQQEFLADQQQTNQDAVQSVSQMRPGDEVTLRAADGGIGYPCIATFNATQAWTLWEAPQTGGIVGFKGVGSGKTVTGLVATLAFPDCKLAVLVIEPKQRHHYYSHYYRVREHFRVPTIVFDNDVPGEIVPGTAPLHLISYSILSRTTNSKILELRNPDVLILDEAHRACGQSAINRRVKRYLANKILERERAIARGETVRARAVRLLDWSGTLENKGVEDTQTLSTYSLGTGSPLPIDMNEAAAWSQVFDVSQRPDRTSKKAKELQRAFTGKEIDSYDISTLLVEDPEDPIRRGFQKRRKETLGVISASAADINASIYCDKWPMPKVPATIREALAKVRQDNLRPDDDLLVDKLEQVACAKNVACGFYSYWAFPKHPCTCVPGEARCDQCVLIDNWYARRKAYNKELRSKLQRGEAELDSPDLCASAAERFYQEPKYKGKLPVWESEFWPAWNKIEQKVQYEERVKWLDDYFAQAVAAWALENRAVIWFQSVPLGRLISEISGLPYFNGGPGGEQRLKAEKGDRSILCSIKAIGAGTDGLQHKFCEQLILETPASNGGNQGLEQVLGRLHREGQRSDTVSALFALPCAEYREAFWKAVAEARFNETMTGNKQKILLADLNNL